ncbi:GAF domain-containing protein [Streptomyces montanisoli]|uniref:GAF domain-containing protein n=1 Tax=Streptomyces montanisoli TaxID=2798581 RepID=A0A940S0P7_9ACTN|nr:GAF domain-containing protein [Streptomyces montanisoli]MBP0461513.1 GAF domain-containing protein [Streptomyces montanisoli]
MQPESPAERPAEFSAGVPRLLEAMRSIGTDLELRSTLDRICETAAELSGARYTAIGVVDETGDGYAEFVTYGRAEDLIERIGVPIRVQGRIFGHLYLADKRGGTEFTGQDLHMTRVLATAAGIAIGNARLYEAARQRERWIDGSVAVTTALLSGGDTTDPLAVVAEQARRLADADAGVVLLPTGDGGLEIVAVCSDTPSTRLGAVLPASPVVSALLDGESVFMDDAASEARSSGFADAYGPLMLLPLESGGRVLGALATPRGRGARRFSETERILAGQFASQAALALMMAEAQRDRERLAVLEDRDRIARDLHDVVIQRLFATGMMLESGRTRETAAEVRTGMGKAIDELDVTIQEIRTAIFALQQTPDEEPSGLRTRVLREIKMAAVPLGFVPGHRFVGPLDTAVGEMTGKNLIAALREALSNAFRHAHATRIEVVVDAAAALDDGTDAVRLSVADDGVGVPEGGRRSGLRNLSRRAEALGGSSRVEGGLGPGGGGTTVVWQAPRAPEPS